MSALGAGLKRRVTSPEMQLRFKRWFDAAPIYTGSIAANRRGWQVVRTRAKNRAIAVRKSFHREASDPALAEVLDRDGILVITDFLDQDAHRRVAVAFEDYAGSPHVRDIGQENGAGIRYLNGPVVSDRTGDSGSVINAALARHEGLIALAEHVIGRRVRPPLRVIFQLLASGDGEDDADREQVLHADKAYPCVKAIYTLDDITPSDSPFIYAKGSHRISPERLDYERSMGIREAYLRRGRLRDAEQQDGLEVVRSRNVMDAETRLRLRVIESAMTCPANSLIITNNAGFHRRGRLAAGAFRRTLWVNFYSYQRPQYGKLAHRLAKSLIDTDEVTRAPAAVNMQ